MTTSDVLDRSTSDRFDALREDILARLGRLLSNAGLSASDVTVTIEQRGSDMHIGLVGPDIPRPTRAALAVRVLDAVHAADTTQGQVDVGYRAR